MNMFNFRIRGQISEVAEFIGLKQSIFRIFALCTCLGSKIANVTSFGSLIYNVGNLMSFDIQ